MWLLAIFKVTFAIGSMLLIALVVNELVKIGVQAIIDALKNRKEV